MTTSSFDVLVNRHDLADIRVVAGAVGDATELDDGQIMLELEKFALTANNISYAMSGDMLGYWNFFPADVDVDGRVPVWGFATVTRSRHPDIAAGERVFGFWPMSTHTILTPSAVDTSTFFEAGPTRAALHPWYNRYFRCVADPLYDEAYDDLQPGLWALFMTGWLLADFLATNDYFGADRVVIASASSKTAYSLAFSVSQQTDRKITVVGLTSSANRIFVEGLGCTDVVATYDEIGSLDGAGRAVFVDMAGNAQVRLAVHERYGDGLVHSCLVGGTHQGAGATEAALPGPPPQFFFVPDHAEASAADWGRQEFTERFAAAWRTFLADASTQLQIERRSGVESIVPAYLDVLAGNIGPEASLLVTLR